MKISTIETGDLHPGNAYFAIIAARFNGEVVNRLLEGAVNTLVEHGVDDKSIDTVYVPGAFEIPLIAKHLVNTKKYSAIIALGCVIRGDTPHFDYVAGECARGILEVSLSTEIPVIFGVLTTDNPEQAHLRSQLNGDNKGVDSALCALEMCNTIKTIREIR